MPILQPEDVAHFAVFPASDRARCMSGGIHVVDSGYAAFKGTMSLQDAIPALKSPGAVQPPAPRASRRSTHHACSQMFPRNSTTVWVPR